VFCRIRDTILALLGRKETLPYRNRGKSPKSLRTSNRWPFIFQLTNDSKFPWLLRSFRVSLTVGYRWILLPSISAIESSPDCLRAPTRWVEIPSQRVLSQSSMKSFVVAPPLIDIHRLDRTPYAKEHYDQGVLLAREFRPELNAEVYCVNSSYRSTSALPLQSHPNRLITQP
jgi:hypothetical protein